MKIKTLPELFSAGSLENERTLPSAEWQLRAFVNDDCLAYAAWNTSTKEALLVDPKEGDLPGYLELKNELKGYSWIAIVDTHTHADHVSCAAVAADQFQAPLVMHEHSPSRRVHLRVSKDSVLNVKAGKIRFFCAPGHTPDGLVVEWGPFLFSGDTILFNDVGRDDLPGGQAKAHYESVQRLVSVVAAETILLPGHDAKSGRAARWGSQLKTNSALTQSREDFIRECEAFEAPAPSNFKKSLVENFR